MSDLPEVLKAQTLAMNDMYLKGLEEGIRQGREQVHKERAKEHARIVAEDAAIKDDSLAGTV